MYREDNLLCLRGLLRDEAESFDLIYLDPPFGTGRVFTTRCGRVAFEDTRTGTDYLEHLWPRLVLCHQLLVPDGTLYIHLAPQIAPYVRILADRLFGHLKPYHRTLIWKRSGSHSNAKSFAVTHDVILFYPKSPRYYFNHHYTPIPPTRIATHFPYKDKRGRFATSDLTGATLKTAHDPNYFYRWGEHTRVWRCPKQTMERLEAEGRLYITKSGLPRRKRYWGEHQGIPPTDIWDDIAGVTDTEERSIGYPTQKPERLLERIILSSTRKGDKILDPYFGSGTSLIVAKRFEREWVGIDSGCVAYETVNRRLEELEEGSTKR
jgi:DNA modification methylase